MRAVLEKLATVWALLGGVILVVIILVTVTNAGAFALDRIARLFGATVTGLPGYEDFVRLAVSAAALMLFPYCQLRRGHVTVDLFVAMTPRMVRRVLEALSLAAMAGLAIFLAYWMLVGLLETRADGVLSRVLGWPEWPFFLPGIISLVLWGVIAATQIFETETDG